MCSELSRCYPINFYSWAVFLNSRKKEVRKEMGRYPFTDSACEYMNTMRGQIADSTWDALNRRYKRMGRDVQDLYQEKEIKTTSPKNMSLDDVRIFLLYRKSLNLSQKELGHEITALKNLLQYNENPAVDMCLFKNPMLRPRTKGKRLPSMADSVYREYLKGPRRWKDIVWCAHMLWCF